MSARTPGSSGPGRKRRVFAAVAALAVAAALLGALLWRANSERSGLEPVLMGEFAVARALQPAKALASDVTAARAETAANAGPAPVAAATAAENIAAVRAPALPAAEQERLGVLLSARPDRHTLDLLASIERSSKGDVPPEVHELVAAWRRGATRQELLERTRRDLPQSFVLRGLVARWVNEVAPDPEQPPRARTPAGLGNQGGRWLAPLRPIER